MRTQGNDAHLCCTARYTTANPENLEQDFEGTDFKAPMAGFGRSKSTISLPVRLY